MAARFRQPGQGVEGFRLEGIDGRVLGRVKAIESVDADLLVHPTGAEAPGDALRRLDWDEVVWIDPVRRALLVSGSGSTTLTADHQEALDAPPLLRARRGLAWTITRLAVATLVVLGIATLVGATRSFSPHQTLYTIGAAIVAAVTFLLIWRPKG